MTTALRPLAALVTALALAGCSPPGNQGADQNALDQAARAAVRMETQVQPEALSDRLIKDSGDFVLLDLRDAAEYGAGHIESAQPASLTDLVSPTGRGQLPPAKDVIVYDADGALGAQAAALLRLAGVERAYFLEGGYAGWQSHVAGPNDPTATDTAAAREAARQAAIACRFEGDYVATAGLVPQAPAGGAYTPGTTPAQPPVQAAQTDALGLGLGLGLGPADAAPQPQAADNGSGLGLGLGLGLGPADAAPPAPRGRLNIGEGC